jgi:hypothetical protein
MGLYLTPTYREELIARYTKPYVPNFEGTLRECLRRFFWREYGKLIEFVEVQDGAN